MKLTAPYLLLGDQQRREDTVMWQQQLTNIPKSKKHGKQLHEQLYGQSCSVFFKMSGSQKWPILSPPSMNEQLEV